MVHDVRHGRDSGNDRHRRLGVGRFSNDVCPHIVDFRVRCTWPVLDTQGRPPRFPIQCTGPYQRGHGMAFARH
jgi:hypothetical protein